MASSDPRFYYENSVIPVPAMALQQKKLVRVFLDSRYRDVTRWPNASSFAIEMDDPLLSVLSAKLINFMVPNNSNMISNSNNVLMFTEDLIKFAIDGSIVAFEPGNIKTIMIPSGNYQPADLATQLQTLMNAVSSTTITVTYDANTQLFSFRSNLTNKLTQAHNLTLSLIFTSPNSCARILGFYDGNIYYGATVEPVTVYYNKNIVAVTNFDQLAVGDAVVIADNNYTLWNGIAYIDTANQFIQLTNVATSNIFNGSMNHGKITAPAMFMPVNVVTNDYVILEIEQFCLGILPSDQPVNRAFAILSSSNFAATQQVAPYERSFYPPLNALRRFMLYFKNFDGQLCDFQNNDAWVELLLTVEKHPNPF